MILFHFLAFSQTPESDYLILTEHQTDSLFSPALKKSLGISFPIFRTYSYEDKSGKHFLILTEHSHISENGNTAIDSIKALNLKFVNGSFHTEWIAKDFILAKGNGVSDEHTISFWTKYLKLEDYDGDGLIDPILVYGTAGDNGTDDGRVKILVYYKGNKSAIRHQNGTLDFQRQTAIDQRIYSLPSGLQERIIQVMSLLTENDHAIFPGDWQQAMKDRKLKLSE